MLNSLIIVMWFHCLNIQVYWPMAHRNSLKCIVFVMYQVASFQQMVSQRYLYYHQRKDHALLLCTGPGHLWVSMHALLKPSRDVATVFS